jgi:hypothetical protein
MHDELLALENFENSPKNSTLDSRTRNMLCTISFLFSIFWVQKASSFYFFHRQRNAIALPYRSVQVLVAKRRSIEYM